MTLITNKKAFHEYSIEERYEAGMVLEGWEVKAIRAGRSNIKESYVIVKNGELFIIGMHITPLKESTAKFTALDPTRTRKLLLKKSEIDKLIGKVERAGYSLLPLNMHFKNGRIKAEVGLGKGKKLHDKRQSAKEADWERERGQLLKEKTR